MKALTICQPYAHLICLPATDPRHKRVENRTWPTNYRGPLAIHAGKSRTWLDTGESETSEGRHDNYGMLISAMAFGAVVAIAELVDCVPCNYMAEQPFGAVTLRKYPWIATHDHASGPWCWVLADVKPRALLPWRGAQGLFEIPDEALR